MVKEEGKQRRAGGCLEDKDKKEPNTWPVTQPLGGLLLPASNDSSSRLARKIELFLGASGHPAWRLEHHQPSGDHPGQGSLCWESI